MKSRWFCGSEKRHRATSILTCLLWSVALGGTVPHAVAGAPDWLRAVARAPLPKYPDDTNAVMLLNEQVTTINEKGEIKTVFRRAYKILRPQGRDLGLVGVFFDNETELTFLKGWSIPADGKEYEVKEKDAVETSPFWGMLYVDTRFKILKIPAAEPGNVIGYECEQKRRPYVLQDTWSFQDVIPVRSARFILRLPKGWEFEAFWLNRPAQPPRATLENQWQWELEDIPAIEPEPEMPHWRAVAGRLGVTYYPRAGQVPDKSHGSWRDVGLWYQRLAAPQGHATAAIKNKVAELTAALPNLLDKIQALANFAQRDIRYVAIEIGIGGYQPHAAHDIFVNRYGDCKDKVTLLITMLREIGIESYYVATHTSRGAVAPDFPSAMNFNHVILAMRLPQEVPTTRLYALQDHNRLGKLLFFDPTNSIVPLGYLPANLQANSGLLVTEDGGELLQLPLLPTRANQLLRTATLTLTSLGTLSGEVQEVRLGSPASDRRAEFLDATGPERMKVLENFLGNFLAGFRLSGAQAENLEKFEEKLVLRYRFVAGNYAQRAGNLLLLRPRVLGQKSSELLERKERKYPVEFPYASLQSDTFEITLPPGYQVDELPPPVQLEYPFAEYRSKTEATGNVLRYLRTFQIKEVRVPVERLEELKKFYRQVVDDERATVVLKRTAP